MNLRSQGLNIFDVDTGNWVAAVGYIAFETTKEGAMFAKALADAYNKENIGQTDLFQQSSKDTENG